MSQKLRYFDVWLWVVLLTAFSWFLYVLWGPMCGTEQFARTYIPKLTLPLVLSVAAIFVRAYHHAQDMDTPL